jgi:hypothetical protein
MKQLTAAEKKQIKIWQTQIKALEAQLVEAKKREGIDPYIEVKVTRKRAHFERVRRAEAADRVLGHFSLQIEVLAEQADVYIPLSIATGKKVAGMMYRLEGTGAATPEEASMTVRGEGVVHVTLGTLVFAKIPQGSHALFAVRVTIAGVAGKTYTLVIARLNYKLHLTDVRYQQYLKEIRSDAVRLSS